ncbi:MAG: alpha/beta hydrolase, partial [Planctomycetales bacterium]|nr:alpha/beta hydrolase [Planctomycetales bacterium]
MTARQLSHTEIQTSDASEHSQTLMPGFFVLLFIMLLYGRSQVAAADPVELNLWPGKPPGETQELPPEADQTKPDDNLVAGRRIIKLGNVSTPRIAVYRPTKEKDTGAAVVVCPGGGHHILAYDLEGTEVAQWLTSIGVTGIVLKYRVPFRDPERRWLAAVQDAQRAMSLVRSKANEWGLDADRIGICGFSAGGETAGLASLLADRQYDSIDAIDRQPFRPNFALLIYPGGFTAKGADSLRDYITVPENAPPFFFVHAFDDRVTVQNSLLLASALKAAGGSAELHLFATGGHGYGLRPTSEAITRWPVRAAEWMRERRFLDRKDNTQSGHPADHLPPHIRQISHYGERVEFSHDGQRLLFLNKQFGDVMEYD